MVPSFGLKIEFLTSRASSKMTTRASPKGEDKSESKDCNKGEKVSFEKYFVTCVYCCREQLVMQNIDHAPTTGWLSEIEHEVTSPIQAKAEQCFHQ